MEDDTKDSFKVVLIPVIFDTAKRQILIARKNGDPDLPDLTWHFPGGRLERGRRTDEQLKYWVKEKTGYEVKNLGAIFSKVYPENNELLAIYFLCEVFKGEEKIGGDVTELKWVDPEDLEKHFTTSFHTRLKEYIINLK